MLVIFLSGVGVHIASEVEENLFTIGKFHTRRMILRDPSFHSTMDFLEHPGKFLRIQLAEAKCQYSWCVIVSQKVFLPTWFRVKGLNIFNQKQHYWGMWSFWDIQGWSLNQTKSHLFLHLQKLWRTLSHQKVLIANWRVHRRETLMVCQMEKQNQQ